MAGDAEAIPEVQQPSAEMQLLRLAMAQDMLDLFAHAPGDQQHAPSAAAVRLTRFEVSMVAVRGRTRSQQL